MIKEFVDRWEANKGKLAEQFKTKRPDDYEDLVREVITIITNDDYNDYAPDPTRIHSIDDGDYQGTLLFVIAEKGYQPNIYYYVYVSYGSCSGCDTLQAIQGWSDEIPDKEVSEYMQLALNIVQGLKQLKEEF